MAPPSRTTAATSNRNKGEGDETAAMRSMRNTVKSLRTIRNAVAPFLKTLREARDDHDDDDDDAFSPKKKTQQQRSVDPDRVAEAEAAVALTIASLRYMSCRLSGTKADDSLKAELDKMKKVLMQLMKKQRQIKKKQQTTAQKANESNEPGDGKANK